VSGVVQACIVVQSMALGANIPFAAEGHVPNLIVAPLIAICLAGSLYAARFVERNS
jgi:uncharacterized membrane protein YfcA